MIRKLSISWALGDTSVSPKTERHPRDLPSRPLVIACINTNGAQRGSANVEFGGLYFTVYLDL